MNLKVCLKMQKMCIKTIAYCFGQFLFGLCLLMLCDVSEIFEGN